MEEDTVLFGFAEADITPQKSVRTVGFGRTDEFSRGVAAPLLAQVSVWQWKEVRCCLTAIDHIGFSKAHADELRGRLGTILGIAREQVMLCFSHTHSAPNESLEPEYFEFLMGQVCDEAKNARERLEPVHVACGNAYADIGLNRRRENSALDRRIGVWKVCGADDLAPKLILLRLTAHANALKADNYLLSPDYFGAVRLRLEAGYHCPVLLTQGASGNVAPRYFDSRLDPPDAADERFIRSEEALTLMAEEVCGAVKPVLDSLRPCAVRRLAMYSRTLTLAAEVPAPERAREIAREADIFCGIDGGHWLEEVARLNEAGVKEQYDETEVQYFALEAGCLCGVANEIMCEFALCASERLGDERFWLGGYTNGCTGYFPTEEEFDEGGYEVYWSMLLYYAYHGRVFPLKRESASRLVDFVVRNAPAPEKNA